ncbi:putative O-glycosylation ligase, exosortase A system-associated [Sphingomonas gilva]|uniref:Putative O-glycosylation ligase, exosortase A system-associated n=1 Tax=Sphingomonas gilva TaxID=2305907 RepID=A0A396RN17_9SPHN|nr:putative O-glycosylation ligase, exosortase A system-associated [Sphingomonas gilva]RHW17857.1 putative O-glycosylation ligase, exosortase A system-associated [Sphingomonas gilva]
MRDLIFLAFILAIMGAGLKRPFLFVLLYVYIDIVAPQRLTYGFMTVMPISAIAVGMAVIAWMIADDKRDMRVNVRQGLIALLLGWCWYTTRNADFPIEALTKWEWVWKALAFAIFLPLTLRTRLRIEALLLFMTLSIAAIAITGGIKTLAGGGGYGSLQLLVAENSGLYEGSIISTVGIAMIPIILWFTHSGTIFPPDWRVKLFGYALTFACLLLPVGTQARTGLLCIGLLAVLMLRDVKRRMLYLVGAGLLGLAAIPFLPQSFTQRMDTIGEYKADASASTRIEVWKWTWDYVKTHPLGGGFEAYRQNYIRYDKIKVDDVAGNNATVERTLEVDRGRAYHSAYFEMLGEQGWPGFILWMLINLGGLYRMEVLRRRYREGADAWAGRLATALQHAHLIYLLGAVFVGIAFQPVLFMLIGAQIGLDTYLARRRKEAAWNPIRRKKRAGPVLVEAG